MIEEQLLAVMVNSVTHESVHRIPDDIVSLLSTRAQKLCALFAKHAQAHAGRELFEVVSAELSAEHRQWLLEATMVHGGVVSEHEFAALVGKVVQSRWKDMVVQIRHDIAQASSAGDTEKVEELLGTFAHWKEHMQQKGHMLWQKK
jgi:hypothetical protein